MSKRKKETTSTPRKELIKLQKQVLARLEKEVTRLIGDSTATMRSYQEAYDREVATYESESTAVELYEALRKAEIIYLGDYHTLHSSQQTAATLLSELASGGGKVVLAVELVMARHQEELDAFMAGEIDQDEFLERIEYEKYWGFRWDYYRPLFELARRRKMRVVGINTETWRTADKLRARDRVSSEIIARESVQNPDAKVFVIDGDWHVASEHLPEDVESALERFLAKREWLTVFQNSDEIYWELADKGIEHKVDVVKIHDRAFCVMNSPPLVKLQSFLNWQADQEEMALDELTFADDDSGSNYTDQVRGMVDTIAGFFNIDEEGLDQFTVYSTGDLNFLENLVESREFTKAEVEEIKRQISQDESYFIQKKNIIYLANLSVNHAAEEAAHFVNTVCAGFLSQPLSLKEDFYYRALKEAVGFLGSKVINSKRMCLREHDYRELLDDLKKQKKLTEREKLEKLAYRRILEHVEAERGYIAREGRVEFKPKDMYNLELDVHIAVTHGLGYMLGEDLYLALMRDYVTKKEVRALFYERFENPEDARPLYLDWVRKVYEYKSRWVSRENCPW